MLRGGGGVQGEAAAAQLKRGAAKLRGTPAVFKEKVDFSKVNTGYLERWINGEIRDTLGFDDDILAGTISNELQSQHASEDGLQPKNLQVTLAAFMKAEQASAFMTKLWTMLVQAQTGYNGIPGALAPPPRKGGLPPRREKRPRGEGFSAAPARDDDRRPAARDDEYRRRSEPDELGRRQRDDHRRRRDFENEEHRRRDFDDEDHRRRRQYAFEDEDRRRRDYDYDRRRDFDYGRAGEDRRRRGGDYSHRGEDRRDRGMDRRHREDRSPPRIRRRLSDAERAENHARGPKENAEKADGPELDPFGRVARKKSPAKDAVKSTRQKRRSSRAQLDVTKPKEMFARYMRRSNSGRELRQVHRAAARQYQTMYGYTLFSFFAIAGIAYGLGTWSHSKSPEKKQEPRST
ncbi:Serine/arginine repetitive matrix protein 1 [Hondaea fermentalgiana]|uniref:Serine/arginine repetitive matrix protein 1 n=1 Tax=Hondaea fermentalgiana TaxID=2315210 RepID=A0A2R5GPG8_9STRA|nr:Serine/arginine repetitive matrix protein 1 [Hondaea fermentalgiana]|eukprot:GBG31678.1 Serine/arginine repetitive matrix protein 1 [Hondaea fermentalgiana]